MPAVVTERTDEIAIVRLNRPERLNAINADIRRELSAALAPLNSDPTVRAVVVSAAGDRAFCAGQDLDEAASYGIDEVDHWFGEMHAMYAAVRALDKPSVAALFGAVAGAGYQIALYCDLRVAHPEARIGQPEVKTGLGSILGTSQMMWHLPLGLNAQLSLTGEFITGQRAYEIGLLNYLVPRAEVLAKALEVARQMAANPPNAIRLTKERMRELTQSEFDDILAAAKKYQKRAYESGEPPRRMREFLEARKKP
ncbi:MAG: enoyl-CoA hydratase/isomerase family protein [Burkholderiales bacterium]|nr:enoyl-CoA hydratase/isomerase family protein [Burkholderiales bacterium]